MHYMWLCTHCNVEVAYDVVSKHLLLSQSNSERAVLHAARQRPVLVTLDVVSLPQVSHHGDCAHSLLPHSPPEIHNCLWEGTCEGREERGRGRGKGARGSRGGKEG